MYRPIFSILWITSLYRHYLAAEKIWAKNNIADYKHPALILNLPNEQYGTACPASTEREIKFNEEVSVSGNSLFLRNIHYRNETILSSICDQPAEPVMLYDLKNRKYDIGYEVYCEQGKIELKGNEYFRYRPVGENNEVINRTKSLSQYVVDYQEGNGTKFHFTDGSPALMFHWLSKLSFQYLAHTKRIKIPANHILPDPCGTKMSAPIKCISHGLSMQNMKVYLFSNGDENRINLWETQHAYGALEMSQIIPARFFTEPSEILASCRHMNMVPIWKSIAHGQLEKVDLHLQNVIKIINGAGRGEPAPVWFINDVTFGVSGVLEEPVSKRKMYFSDVEHHRQIAIPKIIYRMIEGNTNRGVFNAVIVIHNDPTRISDSDRICTKEDEVPGWEEITNDDPRTGFTYVCHYRLKKVSLPGIFDSDSEDLLSRPFRLDEAPLAYTVEGYQQINFCNMRYKFGSESQGWDYDYTYT